MKQIDCSVVKLPVEIRHTTNFIVPGLRIAHRMTIHYNVRWRYKNEIGALRVNKTNINQS